MERLSGRGISELMPQNVDANDIDVDLYAVNYGVNHPRFAVTMETMLGPNAMLSSSSKYNISFHGVCKRMRRTTSFWPLHLCQLRR